MITDFIAGIYGFGVLGTGLPVEMAALVLFLSPFLLLLFKRALPTTVLIILGELILLSRAVEVLLPTRGQLLVAGLGTGLFLFLFPALLWDRGQKRDYSIGPVVAAALVLAIAISFLLRSLGSTMDLSNEGWFVIIAWLLAIGAGILLPGVFNDAPNHHEAYERAGKKTGWGKITVLSIGLVAVFLLLYFAFTSPTVISSWTRVNYLSIFTMSTLALVLFAWLMVSGRSALRFISRNGVLILTAVFVCVMSLTLIFHQVPLPKTATSYLLVEPDLSPLWIISLLAMLILFPVLFLDFGLLVEEMVLSRPTTRKIGLGFGLASLFLMLMVLGHVFTSVWAYIDPILEPLFRNRFWHIHFIVGMVLTLSMLAVSKKGAAIESQAAGKQIGRGFASLVTIFGLIAVIAAWLQAPDPVVPESSETLKVAGYNIQQGYDIYGQRGHEAQCQVLKQIDADVIGLSENDTARIAGGNFDIVRYLAECLEMHSYGGPRTAAGTFGYALLSKYPIENPETIHLFSGPGLPSVRESERQTAGDQVAVVKAQITVEDKTFNVFVNHFDSYPPLEQPQGFVKTAEGLDNVIAIGDYNCEPGTECFDIIAQVFNHCLVDGHEYGIADEQVNHIFVSPDLACQNYKYVDSDASDHPVVVAEIEI